MIIINIVLTLKVSTACLSHNCDLHEIKVVYDHTRIASYRHLHVGNVGGEYSYWILKGNECSSAGGFPSNLILLESAPNRCKCTYNSNTQKNYFYGSPSGSGFYTTTQKKLPRLLNDFFYL